MKKLPRDHTLRLTHKVGLIHPGKTPRLAGPSRVLLGLFMFAGFAAQANVNKPSKPAVRPANRRTTLGGTLLFVVGRGRCPEQNRGSAALNPLQHGL